MFSSLKQKTFYFYKFFKSNFRFQKNHRRFFLLGTLAIAFLLFIPRPAHALPIVDTILGEGVIATLNAVLYVCKVLVSLGAKLLAYMLKPDIYNFTTEPIIKAGWIIVRDICNLFFLLILIFIAFCTILQIDKYHAKKTLLTLILMALLINFSKPIAIFIFDGSQIMMNYFLGTTGDYTVTISNLSKIADIIYDDIPDWWARWKDTIIWGWGGIPNKNVIAQQLLSIMFLFLYAVALIVMAIFLFIRLVAMWILIIVSPLAFLATAIPDFQGMSSAWWNALFKYCYVGPAIAFFIMLSTKLAESSFIKNANNNQELIGDIFKMSNVLHYVVVIIFLYTGIVVSQKFGIFFAGAVTSRANRVLGFGARHFTGYSLAAKGGRGLVNVFKRHKQAATDAGKEALKQKYPRVHRWTTKEGADAAAKKFWNEKFGTTDPHRQQQEAVAKHEKDMKDKNYTDKDFENEFNTTKDPTRRMACAMARAKLGTLNMTQYEEALKDFEKNDAFKKLFDGEVVKKNVHLVIDKEIKEAKDAATKAGRSLTQPEIDAITEKHVDKLSPEHLAKQNVMEIVNVELRHSATGTTSSTKDMLWDLQSSTDPKKQKLFEKFYSELSPAERKKLEAGKVI